MSIWHEPSLEDIEIEDDELLIYAFRDIRNGESHWVSIKLDIIRKLLEEHAEK
jgi:hypothetical protein